MLLMIFMLLHMFCNVLLEVVPLPQVIPAICFQQCVFWHIFLKSRASK